MFRILIMNGLLISLILIWTSAAKEPSVETLMNSSAELPTGPQKSSLIDTNKEILSRKFSCGREFGGVCIYHKKSCPSSLPSEMPKGQPYCFKKHRCCYTDPTTAAPTTIVPTTIITEDPTTAALTTIVPTTIITEDVTWSDIINACISGNNFKTYEEVTIDVCKHKCVEESGITCKSIEYSYQLQMCSLSDAQSDSDDYMEPCSFDGWFFAEIELNTGPVTSAPTTMAPTNSTTNGPATGAPTTMAPKHTTTNGPATGSPITTAPSNTTTNGVSCSLVWNFEEERPLIMIRDSHVISPPILNISISDDPNRIPEGVKLIFACPGEENVFNHASGVHSKLHGECIAKDLFKVCVNNKPEIKKLGEFSCSNPMHPSIIQQEGDSPFKKSCEYLGGTLFKIGYIYGDFRDFKDLETNICFREEDHTTLWTSTNVNRMGISARMEYKDQGLTMNTIYTQKSKHETMKEVLDKEATSVWNDLNCRNHGGHCVRGGKPCPEHLPYQTSQGEPHCNSFYRCCYSEPCNPAMCTHKGQTGSCSIDSLPGTTGVGSQECKKGCQCFIKDKRILHQFKTVQEQRELTNRMIKGGGIQRCGGKPDPCPTLKFEKEHVCDDCDNRDDALTFVNTLTMAQQYIQDYLVFSNPSSYSKYGDICQIRYPVETWSCTRNNGKWKDCKKRGPCTAIVHPSNLELIECGGCPGHTFADENVCIKKKICGTVSQAENFMKQTSSLGDHRYVFGNDAIGNKIEYEPMEPMAIDKLCIFKNPVETWLCHKAFDNEAICIERGFCTTESKPGIDGAIVDLMLECVCPIKYITERHVAVKCSTTKGALDKVQQRDNNKPVVGPYAVFTDKTADKENIKFIKYDSNHCIMEKPVRIWICTKIDGEWMDKKPREGKVESACKLKGSCIAKTLITTGEYVDGSIDCEVPSSIFLRKHVCDSCQNDDNALKHSNDKRMSDTDATTENTVLAGDPKLEYVLIEANSNRPIYKISSPASVKAWQTIRPSRSSTQDWSEVPWKTAVAIGECINLQSVVDTGHFLFERAKCYKNYPVNILGAGCNLLAKITLNNPEPDTPANCMNKCKENPLCNAFNYKAGTDCVLNECPVPFPKPIPNVDGYAAYYEFPGYKVHLQNVWANKCESLKSIMPVPTTSVECAKKCTTSKDGKCNAFNYQVGQTCELMKCPIPYPKPTPKTGAVGAYHWIL